MLKARVHDGAGCAEEQFDATLQEEAEGEGFEPSKSLVPPRAPSFRWGYRGGWLGLPGE